MNYISDKQKKLRAWFRRRKWHTGSCNNNICAWCAAPAQKGINYVSHMYDKNGRYLPEDQHLRWNYMFTPIFSINPNETINLRIDFQKVYTSGPDFEKRNADKSCIIKPSPYLTFTKAELQHLIGLMDAGKEDYDAFWKRINNRKEQKS